MPRAILILLVLTLANLVNVMDRTLLSVLIQPIKSDLHLSDTQIGLLLGLSFAVVYSLGAIPLARLADRGLHRRVLVGSLIAWSLMTSLGGLAQNFGQFAAARFGVAAGEAGLLPTGYALISKLFSARRRGMAIAIFSLGLPLGTALGAAVAGVLAERVGWRMVFILVGPVGLLLLPFFMLSFPKVEATPPRPGSFLKDAKQLLALPVYRNLWAGHAIATLFGYSLGGFFAAFAMRVHGLTAKQAAFIVAVSSMTTGVAGVVSGGWLHDLAVKARPGTGLYPAAAALLVSGALSVWGLLASGTVLAMTVLIVAKLLYGMITAPTYATAMTVAPVEMRATSSALIGLSTSLIGAALGPLIAGVLSDMLLPRLGPMSLRYALLCAPFFEVVGAVFILRAIRTGRVPHGQIADVAGPLVPDAPG